jgi:hypothetical protein
MLVAGTLVEYYRDNVFLIFLEKTVFIVVVSDFAPTFSYVFAMINAMRSLRNTLKGSCRRGRTVWYRRGIE